MYRIISRLDLLQKDLTFENDVYYHFSILKVDSS